MCAFYLAKYMVLSFSEHMRKFKMSLAHGQIPTDILLARLEISLAPDVGISDLSAPVLIE